MPKDFEIVCKQFTHLKTYPTLHHIYDGFRRLARGTPLEIERLRDNDLPILTWAKHYRSHGRTAYDKARQNPSDINVNKFVAIFLFNALIHSLKHDSNCAIVERQRRNPY